MIHDTTNDPSEIPIEEIELSDKNVTVTEDDDQTLATTTVPIVEEQPQGTFTTNSPRLTEFIKMVQGATTSSPKLNRPDVDQPLNSPEGNPPTNLQKRKTRKEMTSCLSPTRIFPKPHKPQTVLIPNGKQCNKLLTHGKKF